jgi:hypothetical protein
LVSFLGRRARGGHVDHESATGARRVIISDRPQWTAPRSTTLGCPTNSGKKVAGKITRGNLMRAVAGALVILAAAIGMYGVDYVIFVLMLPEHYRAIVGLDADQMHFERQPLGIVLPILVAIGLSTSIRFAGGGWRRGVMIGLMLAVCVAFPSSLYAFVYGSHTLEFVLLNLGRLMLLFILAGALMGGSMGIVSLTGAQKSVM